MRISYVNFRVLYVSVCPGLWNTLSFRFLFFLLLHLLQKKKPLPRQFWFFFWYSLAEGLQPWQS